MMPGDQMKKFTFRVALFAATVALLLLAARASRPRVIAESLVGTRNGDWPSYAGDLRNHHYSPLDQIDAKNFRTR